MLLWEGPKSYRGVVEPDIDEKCHAVCIITGHVSWRAVKKISRECDMLGIFRVGYPSLANVSAVHTLVVIVLHLRLLAEHHRRGSAALR